MVKFLYYGDCELSLRILPLKVPPVVEIYSQSINSWKRIQNVVPCVIHCTSIDHVVNGVAHWVASMETKESHYEFILSLDMAKGVFGEIKLPECCCDDWVQNLSATALKDSLSLFVRCKDGEKEHMDIWVMKVYGAVESWTKQFTFDLCVEFQIPLGVMKNGEIILQRVGGDLALYDPKIQQVKDLRIHGVPEFLDILTYYMVTLVLL